MSGLDAHLATGVTTVSRAWVVSRADGVTLGFTDHDRDLTVDGVICRAASGMGARAVQASTGLSVDNSEVVGALSHDAISAEDIRAGRWDEAEVVAYLVNWADTSDFDILFRGTLGEITEGGGQFSAELRGLAEALNAVQGRVYHSRCDAILGDGRCRADLSIAGRTLMTKIGKVAEDGRRIWVTGGLSQDPHWFVRGRIVFESGTANGLANTIKADGLDGDARLVELWAAPNLVPAVGDNVRLTVGCDKLISTCRGKFANLHNFRGFPHIPGDDWLLAVPAAGAR